VARLRAVPMIDSATLAVFAGAVLMLMLSPGPNMAFVLAHGVAFGWRGGVAAAAGIAVADLVLTVLTAAGVTALITQWPPSFDLLRFGGAIYLLWMAWNTLRKPGVLVEPGASQTTLTGVARRAMLNSLLNPAALLFFMVFLPQFADVGRGDVWLQLLVLGLVLSTIAIGFHAGLGALGGSAARLFMKRPGAARWHSRALALVLLLLAVRLLAISSQPH
jgi:threonine/homoserine/homoserine lactone efflux protein